MALGGGGAYWYDQLRSELRGTNPEALAEWSATIEKAAKRAIDDSGARIVFRGVVDEEGFTLDVDATDSDAVLALLQSIQKCLELMPSVHKLFYSTLMEAVASQAEEKEKLEGPWHLELRSKRD